MGPSVRTPLTDADEANAGIPKGGNAMHITLTPSQWRALPETRRATYPNGVRRAIVRTAGGNRVALVTLTQPRKVTR